MKQLCLIATFFLFAYCSSSKQIKTNLQPYQVENTVEVDPTIKSDELYIRARRWFVDEFKSANDVLQVQDKSSGELIGKGSFEMFVFSEGYVSFTISVFVKDGKYKYQFTNFNHKGVPIKNRPDGFSFGLVTTDEQCPYKMAGIFNQTKQKNWNNLRLKVEKQATEMANDLKRAMAKSSTW